MQVLLVLVEAVHSFIMFSFVWSSSLVSMCPVAILLVFGLLAWFGDSFCWRWRFEASGYILLLPVWMRDREGVLLDLVVAFGLMEGVLCFLLMLLRVVS